MLQKKAVGRGGAARKYDLLTILGTYALSQDRGLQRQTLRLICLITARYNWQLDQLSVGQEEIARLWSVDPRTVKREMAAFRNRAWLVEKRAAARGRVTLYGLGIARILEDTRACWERVGPDLVERLAPDTPAAQTGPSDAKIIPFPQGVNEAPPADGTLWGEVSRLLYAEDASMFRAWLAGLRAVGEGDLLVLEAAGSFQARYIETHMKRRIELALAHVAPGLGLAIRAATPR
ncbi:hypothetical protein HOY34_16550 [Xinfangfangia sp. D13-10-4-6]|uniref:hypothetical protein n=1 Tax=Pseudogemmobacter hezensis TaxID=2737662 RepID=UPI001555DCC1|nr:hypothetical protein [Pseudogemmobacter hezensis]NPD16804.1 hypothetical protein [Pseudogemmobacter hezensis]